MPMGNHMGGLPINVVNQCARRGLAASNLKDELVLLEIRRLFNQAVGGIWFLAGSFTNQNTPAAAATAAAPNITTMIWKLLA